MISGLAILLICQLLGELLAGLLNLPVPGPVIGMILLFCGLVIIDRPLPQPDLGSHRPPRLRLQGLETAAQGLLQHLALMFVPAGVGIVAYITLIREEGLIITLSLIVSTALTLVVTGGVMQRLTKDASPHAPQGKVRK